MNKCGNCTFNYYENDTDYDECWHPDFDEENQCPGYYSKKDAEADTKYSDRDKY